MPSRWATIGTVAEYLGVTQDEVMRMIRAGRLQAYEPVRTVIRLDLNEVDAAVTAHED